ncbi:MAG: hypothetical protein GQ574_20485 [Crocinitomix sp.]|nr:hypothetical protein [Crocinitomix sp.]
MKRLALLCFLLSVWMFGHAQNQPTKKDSILNRITLSGDFRFRAEHDWNSFKSNGTFREDRSRLRYRLRVGFAFQINSWSEFGANIRTGLLNKQQDPQLTLGDGFGDNGILPVGFYRLYFQLKKNGNTLILGKNDFPFEKNNELFWSDHVCPEGIFLRKKVAFESKYISNVGLGLGHFILKSRSGTFDMDSYLQGVQITTSFFNKRLNINPAFYYLNKINDIPDGFETFNMNYAIFNLSMNGKLLKSEKLKWTIDYYKNFKDYSQNEFIPKEMENEVEGYSASLAFGELKSSKDWMIKLSYANMEAYSAISYFAQNDWARWDYSSSGSPDGRLTNFQGIRFTAGYAIRKNFILKLNYFKVEQLKSQGFSKETGDRIRLDLDIKF